ncbi:glycosyltransferase family 2 protein [Jeotgalibacillus soli]|uniref:Capsular polysaccharide biosynthsis protein n=1 Tax=Jeotgalibacillus soli TaxID=889306 RepID=A0A0C2VY63_9BACL|nr:glycosyltransferase [Jeotgalibacillus soli]KIL49361.1 capsular polysaccharide biosynthsis protein [Jeotgalibacillus soli]
MKPEISIIVPVYNVEPYLSQCLDSILAQTFTNFEVIVVNDGSTDKSGGICDEYARKDPRIKVVHKEYGGVSSSRNVGMKAAQGNYIGFVDGDDRIDANMYQELYRLCVETASDISICKLGREIDGKLINKVEAEFIKELNHTEAMRELFKGVLYRFSLCNKLFNKKCFESIQFPEGRIHEDLSTTYKLFSNSNKAVYKEYIGYIYIKRKESILTSRFSEKRLDAFLGWDEIISFMSQEYPQLVTEVIASFTYGCVDNIYYVFDQVEGKQEKTKFLNFIQKYIRKHYRKIIKNYTISRKYKVLITLINFNTRIFYLANNSKKYLLKAY